MAITLEHFCTKTGKPIVADGKPVTETIDHCLAEYFAPNATYKIGVVYPDLTTEEDLKQFEGLNLQFSADDRFYFMDEELRDKLMDQPHFGAAYGSNIFTPCKSFGERENLRVLVVEASTGENGGVIPNEVAIKLVGDGDGKIDQGLHESLGNEPKTPFQTRFGIKERHSGLDPDGTKPKSETWQLGKGTFAPRNLSLLGNGYDLVISTDQLKGRKNKENELGLLGEDGKLIEVGNEIKPGEYVMKVGIGNKTDAYYGITSTGAQFWNSFPKGVEGDVLPRLEKRLEELKEMASDPREIAQDYINSIDRQYQYKFKEENQEEYSDFANLNLGSFNKLVDDSLSSDNEEILLYRLLKADLAGHVQVLELPRVIDKLQEHWREQYMDCATGRFIKFDSAMAQTCHELASNEVYHPNFPNGAELIVYRGPTANSNTVGVYTNRHLPDEPFDKGTVKMSPTGLKLSLSDCDGDRMAIALATEFPNTTAEIKEKQLEENRYAEIVKLAKKAYEGNFEQIALNAMENKVGLIANLCMKGIALENECTCVPKEEAFKLMRNISIGAVEMLEAESNPNKPVTYLDSIRKQIVELSEFCQEKNNQADISQYDSLAHYNESRDRQKLPLLSEQDVDRFLEKSREFYHNVVGILGGQLQIEVDRGKSANRSNSEVVNAGNAIVTNPDIAPWVEERKIDEVYTSRPMNSRGHGAIDMMVRMTNKAFEENSLVARSTQQFQDLFKGVEFTPAQKDKADELKRTYDTLMNRAIEISREVEEAPGPRVIATSAKGNSIEIIGLAEFKHPNAFDTSRKLDVMIVENNNPSVRANNKWIAIAPIFGSDGKPEVKDNGKPIRKKLGYISEESANKYPERMKKYGELSNLTSEILPGLAQPQVRAAFKQAKEFAAATRDSIPDSQKEAMAAAMWKISTAGADREATKKSSAVFSMFGDEIVGRLHEPQLTDFAVVGTHKPANEHLGRKWVGEKVPCSIIQAPDPADPTQNKRWLAAEGKKLGVFRSESAQLPIGTQFEATIASPPSASVVITSTKGNQLKVGELKKFAFPHQEWNGESAKVTINVQNNGKTPVALIDGKPLGVIDRESFTSLSEKLSVSGKKVQGFQFNATLESAPATIAKVELDPETIRYPEVWVKEEPTVGKRRVNLFDELKSLLKDKYKEKHNEGLLHDESAGLGAIPVNSGEHFETFMQERGQNPGSIQLLSEIVERKFGTRSFIGIASQDEVEELYFCVNSPTKQSEGRTAQRIAAALNFPLEYDQLENGQRTKFIGIPLDEIQELMVAAQTQVEQQKERFGGVGNETASLSQSNRTNVEIQPNAAAQSTASEDREVPSESTHPLANLQPLNERVAPHFSKDVAMAEVATQFIGMPVDPSRESSTRNYREAWGNRANSGVYSSDDVIMVSGNTPSRATQQNIEETFERHYVPLLEKAVAAGASFVVGDARGCDQLVQEFLAAEGYSFERAKDGFLKCTSEEEQVSSQSKSKSTFKEQNPAQPQRQVKELEYE